MSLSVSDDVRRLFPGIKIVVATVGDIKIRPGAAERAKERLALAWANAGSEVARYGNAQSHPNILPWVERMKQAGAPRKHFPTSIEALLRRAGKGGDPACINPFVDFYNAVSLENVVPAGGYDMDDIQERLELRLSRPGDSFRALDEEADSEIPSGEVSYTDGSVVVTRQFVWKQSRRALLRESSSNVLFLSEVLGDLPEQEKMIARVSCAFAEGIRDVFGSEAEISLL